MNAIYLVLSWLVVCRLRYAVWKSGLFMKLGSTLASISVHATRYWDKLLFCLLCTGNYANNLRGVQLTTVKTSQYATFQGMLQDMLLG